VLQRRADLHFLGASLWPCLGIPSPQRTEKEETLERNVETKPDWIDVPNSYTGAAARRASGDRA
jgi:hypothetical protein